MKNYFKIRVRQDRDSRPHDSDQPESEWRAAVAGRARRIMGQRPQQILTPLFFFTESTIAEAWARALAAAHGDMTAISVWRQPAAYGLWRNVLEVGENPSRVVVSEAA